MTRHTALPTILVILCISTPPTLAAPVQSPETGHFYESVPVPAGITWDVAKSEAGAATFTDSEGILYHGHLAAITSAEENAFITANCPGAAWNPGYWLGGFQEPGSTEPGAGWQWVTGESFEFAFWAPGEPNDNSGRRAEDKLHFAGAGGDWNDVPSDARLFGYVIEYEPDETNSLPVADAGGPYAAETDGVLVDVEPNKLNLRGKARWVTVYLLPDEADTVEVVLDGTGSYDPDGDPLAFSWTVRNESGAGVDTLSGPSPSVELGIGTYTIELVVNDGHADSEPSESEIEVTVIELGSIAPESLMLYGPAPGSPAIGRRAELDEWGTLMVKFNRDDLRPTLVPDKMNLLTLDGAVQGEDTVMVVDAKP